MAPGRSKVGVVDPGSRRSEMGGAARREPIVANECHARRAAKTLQVAQQTLRTALNRLTPKSDQAMASEVASALEEIGL